VHVVDCAYAYGQFWELLFDFATPVHLDLHAHHVLFIIQALDIKRFFKPKRFNRTCARAKGR